MTKDMVGGNVLVEVYDFVARSRMLVERRE